MDRDEQDYSCAPTEKTLELLNLLPLLAHKRSVEQLADAFAASPARKHSRICALSFISTLREADVDKTVGSVKGRLAGDPDERHNCL